jgi:methanogenic corrinoid protein MtbC1
MTELNETAPSRPRFGNRPGPASFESGRVPLVVRGTTISHLSKTIEAEIIPRLVMAHGPAAHPLIGPEPASGEIDIPGFAELVLGRENSRAAGYIQHYRDRGVSLERVYLEIFVPTARHLRHLWTNDERDFAEITLGLWRLQQLLRDFSPAFCADTAAKSAAGFRALLTPSHGEQHDIGHMMFGLVLAGEFFRRDGWDTWIEPDVSNVAFIETIRTQWFDVVEFFASGDKKLDDLASTIRLVRRHSPNPGIGVMVCGPAFTERPELVLLVGADAVVSDFSQEALQARNVVSLLTERR